MSFPINGIDRAKLIEAIERIQAASKRERELERAAVPTTKMVEDSELALRVQTIIGARRRVNTGHQPKKPRNRKGRKK